VPILIFKDSNPWGYFKWRFFNRAPYSTVAEKGWLTVINETLEAIRQRRSIRTYETRQISDSELSAVLEAALFAPTALNQQKWHFAVVQKKSVLAKMDRIARENKRNSNIPILVKSTEQKDYHTYYRAPTVVIVSGEQQAKFIQMDCAAAAQNIALAAGSMGIGSCIMTSAGFLFASAKGLAMKKELGIPDNYDHICSVALGYCNGGNPAAPPRNREVFSYIK
jgi:nitroreductase